MDEINDALNRLDTYVRKNGYAGYDPYDALTGRLDLARFGKWPPIFAIQLLKRLPVNIRPLLGIRKTVNPKALGLFLDAYSRWAAADERNEAALTASRRLFRDLIRRSSASYSGYCWGYPFDWASPVKFLPAGTPSAVVTGVVARGIHSYCRMTQDDEAAEVLRGACRFLMEDLPIQETPDGVFFSYTPIAPDCCYNASLLAAEALARTYDVTGDSELRDMAVRAAEYVARRQHSDGRWNYSMDLTSGKEREQVDFHQGFVIDSLRTILRFAAPEHEELKEAVRRGAAFYREHQFTGDGRARWRLPAQWPADIHHQAQGILTFSRLGDVSDEYPHFASTVARWTIRHMQDDSGYFYFRKGRFTANRIGYVRWGQAWMMLALVTLIGTMRGMDEVPVSPGTSGTFSPVQARHPVAS